MIKKYRLPIQAEGGLLRFEHSYALYGELMSRIDSDIADMLHMEGFTPLSQHLELNREGAAWIVTTFDDTVSEAFLCAVHEIKGISLRDSELILNLSDPFLENETSFESLLRESSNTMQHTRNRIEFVSPTGFKSDEQYVLYPTSDLILKSLITKWNAVCTDYVIDDAELVKMLLSSVSISGYKLSSYDYRMKNQHIRAFSGSVSMRAKLSAPLERIYTMLLRFGEYSGVGIKTALGMGGIKIIKQF